eukprot:5025589-Amphidinium_carterae.2
MLEPQGQHASCAIAWLQPSQDSLNTFVAVQAAHQAEAADLPSLALHLNHSSCFDSRKEVSKHEHSRFLSCMVMLLDGMVTIAGCREVNGASAGSDQGRHGASTNKEPHRRDRKEKGVVLRQSSCRLAASAEPVSCGSCTVHCHCFHGEACGQPLRW